MKIKRILLAFGFLVATTSTSFAQKYVEYTKPLPGEDVIGEIVYVTPKRHESLVDLTIRYEMGYDELRWANPGINAWMLSETQPLVLPTQFILPKGKRSGIVSNIPEMRTYYFLKGSDKIYVYPVGVGRMDWKTPLGSWSITRKQEHPNWYPPESIRREHEEMGRGTLPRVVPAGPDNPLGTRVLRLALPSYLLHGTNDETGIGMRVTHGCMRFYPQHIEHLYDMVPTNTMVTFLNEPVKYGVIGNDILIEVHPPLEEDNLSVPALKEKALTVLNSFLKDYPDANVNQDLIGIAVQQQTGLPVIIGQKNPSLGTSNTQAVAPVRTPITPMVNQPVISQPAQTPQAMAPAPIAIEPISLTSETDLPDNPDHRAYEDMTSSNLSAPKVEISTREIKQASQPSIAPVFRDEGSSSYTPPASDISFPPPASERTYQAQPTGKPVSGVSNLQQSNY